MCIPHTDVVVIAQLAEGGPVEEAASLCWSGASTLACSCPGDVQDRWGSPGIIFPFIPVACWLITGLCPNLASFPTFPVELSSDLEVRLWVVLSLLSCPTFSSLCYWASQGRGGGTWYPSPLMA